MRIAALALLPLAVAQLPTDAPRAALACYTSGARDTLASAYALGEESYCTFSAETPADLLKVTVAPAAAEETPSVLFDRGVTDYLTERGYNGSGLVSFQWTVSQDRLPSPAPGSYEIECVADLRAGGRASGVTTFSVESESDASENGDENGDGDDTWAAGILAVMLVGACGLCSIVAFVCLKN